MSFGARFLLFLLLAGSSACAARAEMPSTRDALVARAASVVGVRSMRRVDRRVTDDCSGFVQWVFGRSGVPLDARGLRSGENAVTALHRIAKRKGVTHRRRPEPGDLVFFRETYDRNRDGRRNDGLTHVGIVEKVERDGTVTFIHRGSRGIARSRLNRERATVRRDRSGKVLNDYLRVPSPRPMPRLSGQLVTGFASPEAF